MRQPQPVSLRQLAYSLCRLASLLILLICVASCSGPTPGPDNAGGKAVNLNGAGATFPYPLYSKWIAEFAKVNPQVRINYQSIGSGGGIQQLKNGTVDFGASDAPLSDKEMKEMPAPVIHIPAAAGAVVVAYNLPGLKQGLRLSPETLSGIYLGEITRWNDKKIAELNPQTKLPALDIAVVHRSDGSGTSYIFTNYLAAVSKPWAEKVGAGKAVNWPAGIGGKGNEGVTGAVKQTPGSIGYLELAYARQNKLTFAAIKNQAGSFIEPSITSTTAAAKGAVQAMEKDVRISIVNSPAKDAYPISGFTYLLVYQDQKDAGKGEALVKFLDWAIHDGQKFAEALLYAPLPPEVVKLDEQALKSIHSQKGKP